MWMGDYRGNRPSTQRMLVYSFSDQSRCAVSVIVITVVRRRRLFSAIGENICCVSRRRTLVYTVWRGTVYIRVMSATFQERLDSLKRESLTLWITIISCCFSILSLDLKLRLGSKIKTRADIIRAVIRVVIPLG